MQMQKETYSVEKKSEGGRISQKDAIKEIKRMVSGSVKACHSIYVGHYGLQVVATEAEHEKVNDFLFG